MKGLIWRLITIFAATAAIVYDIANGGSHTWAYVFVGLETFWLVMYALIDFATTEQVSQAKVVLRWHMERYHRGGGQ